MHQAEYETEDYSYHNNAMNPQDLDVYAHEPNGNAGGNMMANPLEQLQWERETEFMTQLLAPLIEAPDEVFQYVEAELRDRLHQTVRFIGLYTYIIISYY
jgi:hypothetical protein